MEVMKENKTLRSQVVELESQLAAIRKEGGAAEAATLRVQRMGVDMEKLRRQLKQISDAQYVWAVL